jgi:ATP adenylyltransferase
MKNLWAPWRIEYILSDKSGPCVFCTAPGAGDDRANLILYRGRDNYVILNRYPYNCGHLMVVPYFHTSSFEGLPDETLSEMMHLVRRCTDALGAVMHPEGFNTGLNLGAAAGAGIREHLHMHVVPRWVGDSSFMAVADEVRVVPEHLMVTYDKLYPAFNREG